MEQQCSEWKGKLHHKIRNNRHIYLYGNSTCIATEYFSEVLGGRVRWHRTDSTGHSSCSYYSDY